MEEFNMEELAMCRVCLADDVRMCLIVNTHLQEVYESLTLMPLETKDSRPVQVCYICCAVLQNSYRLRKRSLQSEELFTQLQPVNILESSCTRRLRVVHPVVHLSMGDVVQNGTHDETTEDSVDKTQASDVVVDVKVEMEDAEVLADIKNEADEELCTQSDDNIQCLHLEDTLDIVKSESDVVDTDYEDKGTVLNDNIEESDGAGPSSQSADNICPKIAKIVLERMVLNDTRTGTSDLKKHRLATQISIETTLSKHNRNEQAETTVAEHESVADKPVIISEIQQTIDKVDATLHKRTSENNICLNKTSFRSKSRLQCHTRTHTGEKLFECDVCKKCFNRKYHLKCHSRTHTGEKLFECDVCKKCFSRKYHLKCHSRTHTGEKLFECDVCKKCYRRSDSLKTHMRTHTGEKLYLCDECNKRFTLKFNLTKHMRTHTGEKPYMCDVCIKGFCLKADLVKHMRIHTGEKPYICDVCNKRFTQNCTLIAHTRTHTGEKPYLCDVCNKGFTKNFSLTCHMRTHTGEKPYLCGICNKRFPHNSALTAHMRKHTGEKP